VPSGARQFRLVLAPARRPGWLELGGRWPSAFCVLIVVPLAVGWTTLFAYLGPSVRVGMLAQVLLLSFVMARSRAIRWHDLISLTAMLCLAGFLFFIGPARWVWPDLGPPSLSSLRIFWTPALIAVVCGQVVLALLLLAGLDPQLRSKIRDFVTPVGRGFVLRAAVAIVLLACALWNGRHVVNGGAPAEIKVTVVTTEMELVPSCVRPDPSIAQVSPATAGCVGPANHTPTAIQPGSDTGKG